MSVHITDGRRIGGVRVNRSAFSDAPGGVERGCAVTIDDSSEWVEVRVEAGSIVHDGEVVPVEAQEVTLRSGHRDDPRTDLILVDWEGAVFVYRGVPADPPTAPDAADVDGLPLVWIEVPPETDADSR